MADRLKDRVAIVTGAGRGIGASIAKLMASEGAAVVVNDLGGSVDGEGADDAPARDVVREIEAAGGTAVANFDDVSDYDASEQIIRTALNEYGQLDILCNVAGILRDRMIFNMSEAEWDAVIAVHLKGTFNTSKYASIYWRSERKGDYRLINFTSVSGLSGSPGQPNYAAAKLGIVGLSYSCANALGRYGVTSNAISPGAATRMGDTIPPDRRRQLDAAQQRAAEDRAREMSADNVAPPVVYLASTESGWINGQVIGASGYQVSLFNTPEMIRQIQGKEPWTVDDMFQKMPSVFRPAIEGRNFYQRAQES
ncbi:MAG: SDR family oxidoreductase [Dehalococcoidia bacterium]|nr:SDR family oxidoreductase [Dehalococcoidia bacterium]